MNTFKYLILSTVAIIFFGNIKAENSIMLMYDDGETETFVFPEEKIWTLYRNNKLHYISIREFSEKTPIVSIAFSNPDTTFLSDLTELTTVNVTFYPKIPDVKPDSYPVSLNVVKIDKDNVQFTVTGFQDCRTPEIKQISGSFIVPIIKTRTVKYPAYWEELELPAFVPKLLEDPIVEEIRPYSGRKPDGVSLQIKNGFPDKVNHAIKKLVDAGFQLSFSTGTGFDVYTHPDFNGEIHILGYTEWSPDKIFRVAIIFRD